MAQKPTVMNKEEEKAKEFYCKAWGVTPEESNYISIKQIKIMMEYAQQANMKTSLEFAEWVLKKVDIVLSDFLDESWFEEWQKQK